MKLTLTRYAVRPGKEQLHPRMDGCIEPKTGGGSGNAEPDEKMALEAIFMEEDAKGMAFDLGGSAG